VDTLNQALKFCSAYHLFCFDPLNLVYMHTPAKLCFGTFDKDDMKASRKARREQGLVIDNFVAYPVNYTEETKDEDKHDFWVGNIVEINVEQRQLRLRCYHTGTKNNLESGQASYKLWGNGNGPDAHTTIGIEHVLETFELTKSALIKSATRRQIKSALCMHRTNLQAATQPVDLAVGHDNAGNPGGGGGGGGGGEGGGRGLWENSDDTDDK
jgi:hypothetical protein